MRKDDLNVLFSSDLGKKIFTLCENAISDFSMKSRIEQGVLVGLSGGADSVMLLCFLLEYRNRNFHFPIMALHVNHGIRGEEADRDELFSKQFAEAIGVDFLSVHADVPRIAAESGKGIEEAAREVRYSRFREIISGRSDLNTIAVAHNSTDNLETVLMNILRGSGTRGGSGIQAVRDDIIRPLIYVKKEDITKALECARISYVTDSTNNDSDYKRNFVRNEIIPKFKEICDCPEEMFKRFAGNLREDDDYLNDLAAKFLSERAVIKNTELSELEPPILRRVLSVICNKSFSFSLFDDVKALISKDNFCYDIGDGKRIVCERGIVSVRDVRLCISDFSSEIVYGSNAFPDFCSEIILSKTKLDKTSLNVYKISIQHDLSSAIINGGLRIGMKRDGDSIYYGGMTRKLKKLFSDRKIPNSKRVLIPILYDDSGVVCVPGFGVRDDGGKNDGDSLFAIFGVTSVNEEHRFYFGNEFLT